MNRRDSFKGVLGLVVGVTAAPALAKDDGPRWKHHDDRAVWLGQFRQFDLWFRTEEIYLFGVHRFEARYGNRRLDRAIMWPWIWAIPVPDSDDPEWLHEACRRAKARGLLKESRTVNPQI